MNKIWFSAIAWLLALPVFSQHSIRFLVRSAGGTALPGATVYIPSLKKNSITDSAGYAIFSDLPAGTHKFRFTSVGYEKEEMITLPYLGQSYEVLLELKYQDGEEVVIESTRSTRTIRDMPTRVEFIAGEELDEKSNMKPGDIRMVLTESTGVQTQQTSATSANASIRIQGLDGRYTQVLKDGFPLYAGFSSGLGLLQTPPLDLKQLELIKGSASTLYGGGAIAGLVNLISKTPAEKRELNFHLDATSAGGWNTSGFFSQRFKKTGLTLFASRNSNKAYDPSTTGLTAIPEFERYTVNPRLFFYFSPSTQMLAGVNFSTEKRTGGDIDFIKKRKQVGFFERNNTDRLSTEWKLEHIFGKHSHITVKNSLNFFKRGINAPSYLFRGRQTGTFTEITYASHADRSEWISGLNLVTDHFTETAFTSTQVRNYQQLTTGAFIQNNLNLSELFHLETGLRGDYVKDYGFALLPRVSALFRFSPELSSRIGGGLGYKAPTIFSEESERLQYRNVLPVDNNTTKIERSYGVNADINYKSKLAGGELDFSINHLFFYTRITNPLLLQPEGSNYRFNTVDGHIDSKGMESNMRLGYHDFKWFIGYTFTKAYLHNDNKKTENFLTPNHRLNLVLLYEVSEKWKLGLEGYYFSRQQLSDGASGRPYWITGFMAEKLWEKLSLYINFENFLDTRQTRFDSIYTGSINNPQFRDIYAPLDGFVVNGGIKLRL
jgi:outer membrane receptor for ferrienterochelin and colicins